MLVIPAIDLKNGEAVRLYKGDYQKKTVYSTAPEQLAKQFEEMGVSYLHLVDLDGAKDAQAVNKKIIKKIRETVSMSIELGGGIRNMETVSYYLDTIGIDRVILGTAALDHPDFLKEALFRYGADKIIVGVDIKNGFVSTSGWLKTSSMSYLTFIDQLAEIGIKTIICTDISKDGTLQGPNFELYKTIASHSSLSLVVSGGIKDDQDIYQVAKQGYYGCIVGKAYYEGHIDLREVIRNVSQENNTLS